MDDTLLEMFRHVVSEHTGLNIRGQDVKRFSETIFARMKSLRLSSASEYYNILNAGGERGRLEWKKLATLLTTGETYFFRDRGQFSLIRLTILPELIERNRKKKSIRIWSAGCSTGEEVYSLAIIIDEIVPDRKDWEIILLGTDINEEAIKKARDGYYNEWSFRHIGGEIKERYFKNVKNRWLIDEPIRDMAKFEVMDLISDRYPCNNTACGIPALHDADMILCRNVFIYFNPDIVFNVASKMADTLNDGGYLITGHAELKMKDIPPLRTMVFPESVVYQKTAVSRQPSEAAVWPASGIPEAQKQERISKPEIRMPESPLLPLPSEKGAAEDKGEGTKLKEAKALADRGRYDEAARCCMEAAKAEPFNASPYYLLAQIAHETGDIEKEKETLKRVIYLEPSHVAAFLELSIIYEGKGDIERAAKMRKAALGLLRALPSDANVEPYTFTAGELIEHVEKIAK